jgi:hypothetical protein
MHWSNNSSPCRWTVGASLALLGLFTSLPAARAAGEESAALAAAKAAAEANNLQQTRTLGGSGKTPFSETSANPSVLIGFELGLGKFFNLEVIYALRPIYLTAEGERRGPPHGLFQTFGAAKRRSKVTRTVWVTAKPGYAVGGLTGRAGLLLNGMAVTFMRLDGGKLNPDDKYQSDWIGDRTGGSETAIDSQGMLVVGIHGKEGDVECQALGLVHVAPPKPVAKTRAADPRRPSPPPRLDTPEDEPVEPARRVNVAAKKVKEKPVAPRESASSPPPPPVPSAEPRQREEYPPAKPAAAQVRQEDPGASGWGLPVLVGVLVAVLGIGGMLMLTTFKRSAPAPAAVPPSTGSAQPGVHLPPELEARIRQELTQGEQLIWGGQPSPRVTRMRALGAMGVCLLLALFGGVLAAAALVLRNGPPAESWPLFVGLGLFVLVSLGCMCLAPGMKKRQAARTAYAITNRRALVHRPGIFGNVAMDSYGPVQLQQMVRRDWWLVKGAGDLIFATEKRLQVTTTRGRYGSSSTAREKIIHYGFLGIDDPVAVEKLLREVLVNPLVDKIQA